MQEFVSHLSRLSNDALVKLTRDHVSEERRVGTRILHALREIERRRLFSELGYQSLFDFCVRGLGYSEGGAQRRIQAARLLREMPELEQKIQEGKLSLSVVGQAQTFFRQEAKQGAPIGIEEKREILQQLEGKSSRGAQRELASISSVPIPSVREKVREVSEEISEIRFGADRKLMDDLEKIRGLLAHKHPNLSYGELIRLLAELGLEKFDPARKNGRQARTASGSDWVNETKIEAVNESVSIPEPVTAPATATATTTAITTTTVRSREVPTSSPPASAEEGEGLRSASRYIPASVRREVWKRDQGKCVVCGSNYALQIDHIEEFALGGSNEMGNLRLLCRSCNQAKAIRTFGIKKMDFYLAPPR